METILFRSEIFGINRRIRQIISGLSIDVTAYTLLDPIRRLDVVAVDLIKTVR